MLKKRLQLKEAQASYIPEELKCIKTSMLTLPKQHLQLPEKIAPLKIFPNKLFHLLAY